MLGWDARAWGRGVDKAPRVVSIVSMLKMLLGLSHALYPVSGLCECDKVRKVSGSTTLLFSNPSCGYLSESLSSLQVFSFKCLPCVH